MLKRGRKRPSNPSDFEYWDYKPIKIPDREAATLFLLRYFWAIGPSCLVASWVDEGDRYIRFILTEQAFPEFSFPKLYWKMTEKARVQSRSYDD
jgi:hypothetical protein